MEEHEKAIYYMFKWIFLLCLTVEESKKKICLNDQRSMKLDDAQQVDWSEREHWARQAKVEQWFAESSEFEWKRLCALFAEMLLIQITIIGSLQNVECVVIIVDTQIPAERLIEY